MAQYLSKILAVDEYGNRLIFNDAKEAAEYCGICFQTVYKAIKYGYVRGGYTFDIIESKRLRGVNNYKAVDCYDLDGNFYRHFDSVKDAAAFLHTTSTIISRVCRGKQRSIKQYTFRYTR